MSVKTVTFPREFVWRRLHSLFGLWLVLFLIEHMLTNSQAALLIGENGKGFIRAVNFLKNLPYLHVIEIVLLGVPIFVHMLFGIKYLMTSKINSIPGKANRPLLTKYSRNHAYTLQRLSSWVLLFGIIAHVGYMRFYMYPATVDMGTRTSYFVRLYMDPGLYTVSDRLGVHLFDKSKIDKVRREIKQKEEIFKEKISQAKTLQETPSSSYQSQDAELLREYQILKGKKAWLKGLEKRKIGKGEVIAEASNFGTATLLIVRNSFKSIFKSILYTIFVLAAVFHAFNGLWTFMITWGIVLKMRSQSQAINVCIGIMILIGFLGLASIWGTYFINLRN